MPVFHYTPQYRSIIPNVTYVPSYGEALKVYDIRSELNNILKGKWLIYEFKHPIHHQNGLDCKSYKLYMDNCCNLWKLNNVNIHYGPPSISIEFQTLHSFNRVDSPSQSIYNIECNHIPLNDKIIDEIKIVLDNCDLITRQAEGCSSLKLPSKEFFDIYINRAKQYAEFIDRNYRRLPFLHLENRKEYYYPGYYNTFSDEEYKTLYGINLDLVSDNEIKSKLLKEIENDLEDAIGNDMLFTDRYDITIDFIVTKFPELLKTQNDDIAYCSITHYTPEFIRKKYNTIKWCTVDDCYH